MKFALRLAGIAFAALCSATAAQASFSTPPLTFATFSTLPGGGFYWENNTAQAGNGKGGHLFTSLASSVTTPSDIPVLFSFVAPGAPPSAIAAYTNVPMLLRLDAYVANTAATLNVSTQTLRQNNVKMGVFEFYVPGPSGNVVFYGTFNNARIVGQNNTTASADLRARSIWGPIVYNSPFMAFAGPPYQFTITKTGLSAPFSALPSQALNSFDPGGSGSFALGGTVPEPASWALMIAGFGMTGRAMRRRRPAAIAA